MKNYLQCTITSHDGRVWTNPLKLGEARLISQVARDHEKIVVTFETTNAEHYKSMFG